LQSGRSLGPRPQAGMGLGPGSGTGGKRGGRPVGRRARTWKPVAVGAGHDRRGSHKCYGDFGADGNADAAAAGDGALASPGFTLINSTSKMSVAFGPISPPVPPGP